MRVWACVCAHCGAVCACGSVCLCVRGGHTRAAERPGCGTRLLREGPFEAAGPPPAQAASVSGRAVSRRRSVSAGRTLHLTLLPSTPPHRCAQLTKGDGRKLNTRRKELPRKPRVAVSQGERRPPPGSRPFRPGAKPFLSLQLFSRSVSTGRGFIFHQERRVQVAARHLPGAGPWQARAGSQ